MKLIQKTSYEMANIFSEESGLPVNIWIDELGKYRSNKHSLPRLKIQNDYGKKPNRNKLIPISIEKEPKVLSGTLKLKSKDFKIIQRFIQLNLDILIKHWNGDIGTQTLMIHLKTPNNSDLF